VFRSDDRGSSWQRVDTGIAVDTMLQQIAVSPVDPDLLLVGDPGGDRLLRSTDAGAAWSLVPIAAGWNTLSAIKFDPHDSNVALAAIRDGAQRGVRRSTDAGLTWVASSSGMSPPDPSAVAFHPGAAGVVLASNGAGVFRSTNGGTTWSQVHVGYSESVSFSGTGSRAFAIASNEVVRSDDGGLTFTAVTQPPGTKSQSFAIVTASPADANTVLVGQLYWRCSGACFSSTVLPARRQGQGIERPA
jgi:photosystem II stability/assembly factor-like uncharacterized protein